MKIPADTRANGEPIATTSFYICRAIKIKKNIFRANFNQFFHSSFVNCVVYFPIIVNAFQNNVTNGTFVHLMGHL